MDRIAGSGLWLVLFDDSLRVACFGGMGSKSRGTCLGLPDGTEIWAHALMFLVSRNLVMKKQVGVQELLNRIVLLLLCQALLRWQAEDISRRQSLGIPESLPEFDTLFCSSVSRVAYSFGLMTLR